MAQSEGILGAVKNYIPGMNTTNEEHHKKSTTEDHEVHEVHETAAPNAPDSGTTEGQSGGGLLSYIPGFGGGSSTKTDNVVSTDTTRPTDPDAPRTTRAGTVYNQPEETGTGAYGSSGVGTGSTAGGVVRASAADTPYKGDSVTDREMNSDHGTGSGTRIASGYGSGSGTEYEGSKPGIGNAVTTTTGDINHTKTRLNEDEPGYTTKTPSSHAAGGYGHTATGGSTAPRYSSASDSGYASKPSTGSGLHHSSATDTEYAPNTGSAYGTTGATDNDYAPKTGHGTSTGAGYGTAGRATDTDYAPKAGYGTSTDAGYGTTRTPGSGHHLSETTVGSEPSSKSGARGTSAGAGGVPGSAVGGDSAIGGSAVGGGYTPQTGSIDKDYRGGNPGFETGQGGVATTESDVKGAPIEGENVKGYTVSAPVGTGDVNALPTSGDPSGQVSGAHMEYGPVDVDDRDSAGRGTVGRTVGDGDSSFANVKRNIKNGTEHVVSNQSTSRVRHNSVTQM